MRDVKEGTEDMRHEGQDNQPQLNACLIYGHGPPVHWLRNVAFSRIAKRACRIAQGRDTATIPHNLVTPGSITQVRKLDRAFVESIEVSTQLRPICDRLLKSESQQCLY